MSLAEHAHLHWRMLRADTAADDSGPTEIAVAADGRVRGVSGEPDARRFTESKELPRTGAEL